MSRVIALVVVLIAVTVLIVWVAGGVPAVLGMAGSEPTFATQLVWLVLLISVVVLGWRGSASQAVRYFLIWLAIGFALVLGYSYRNDVKAVFQRVGGEVNPALPEERGAGQVVLRPARDGHFYADVEVNGRSVRMLADTGASTIALSVADAEDIGIAVDELDFIYTISTANGPAPAAKVDLEEVRVGPIVRQNVRALVTRELSGSLLGMNFFSSLSKVAMESGELVLED
jgi:aspartyl protease family protein